MHTRSGSQSEPDILIADLGTTNIVVSNGIETVRMKNPQIRYGSDIISRILYSLNNGPLPLQTALHKGLIEAVTQLSGKISSPVKIIVLTGNTVMMHFLLGLDTSGMASYPFTPVSLFNTELTLSNVFSSAAFLPSIISPEAEVYLPPCIESFVGADLVCASVGCGLYGLPDTNNVVQHGSDQFSSRLVIDIGTNTEILLYHKDHYFACSTAAGPAFEGGNMKSTLRGSELLHTLALLLDSQQMDNTGMLVQEKTLLSQSDVRQLQLAKSAICAAVHTLLYEASASPDDITEVFLCGAFGSNILPSDISKTGLLEFGLSQKITVKELAVIEGAILLAKSLDSRNSTVQQAKETVLIQLADNAFFAQRYIECMNF